MIRACVLLFVWSANVERDQLQLSLQEVLISLTISIYVIMRIYVDYMYILQHCLKMFNIFVIFDVIGA